jgi:hypothetical protein
MVSNTPLGDPLSDISLDNDEKVGLYNVVLYWQDWVPNMAKLM